MRKPKKERIKTIILISLIIVSVMQIGIHLNQQTQGFPFDFLSTFLGGGTDINKSVTNIDVVRESYFLPKDITVSKNSFTQWIFSQSNPYYKTIWNDVRQNYLPVILSSKPKKTFPKDKWVSLINETCTRIDFPVTYPKSMMVDGASATNQSFNSIASIAILPQEDVNETRNTVYVYDETSVYKYNIDIKGDMQPKIFYRTLPTTLTDQVGLYMPMSALGQSFSDYRTDNPDIPIYVDENSSHSFQTISAKLPDAIVLDPASDDLDSVQESILLNQKDSFIARHLEDNTAVFSDLDNVYELDSHGVLKYKYLPKDSTGIGEIKNAFDNAISFIELRKHLVGNTNIVLSSIAIDKKDNCYIFGFNYMLEGERIYVTDIKESEAISSPAIEIKATADRVLECQWIIREFTGNNDYTNYRVSFTDLINMIMAKDPLTYSNLYINENSQNKEGNNLKFNNIQIGYSFDVSEDTSKPLSPYWLYGITEKNYKLRLQIEEGD